MNLADTYDKIAEDWDADHAADTWQQGGIDALCARLPIGGRVLDIGCGPGHKAKIFAERGFEVVGEDISSKMVELAQAKLPGLTFRTGDMTKLEEHDAYDGIAAIASLLHVPKADAGDTMRRFAAALRPGGHLLVSVKAPRAGQAEEQIATEHDYGYEYSRFFSYFTTDELRRLMTDAGLEIVWEEETPANQTIWVQLIGKKQR